MKHFLKLKE